MPTEDVFKFSELVDCDTACLILLCSRAKLQHLENTGQLIPRRIGKAIIYLRGEVEDAKTVLAEKPQKQKSGKTIARENAIEKIKEDYAFTQQARAQKGMNDSRFRQVLKEKGLSTYIFFDMECIKKTDLELIDYEFDYISS